MNKLAHMPFGWQG